MVNASKKDNDKVERQLEGILIPGEQVELAYVLVRDLIVFTDKRLILVDKQGNDWQKRLLISPFLIARSVVSQ